MTYTYRDLIGLFEESKKKYGDQAYRHISELLSKAKQLHHANWVKNPTANGDHEQSWRAFKGKNLERLIVHIIESEVETLGLKIVQGNTLERTKPRNLPKDLSQVRQNLLVGFPIEGKYHAFLPDVDIIIYDPKGYKVIAVLSSKVTLRERIAQTGYWKIKLIQNKATSEIKVFFITPDEDGTLTSKSPMKKGRAIVEVDTDGAYVMTEKPIEQSNKVKSFDQFIADLKSLLTGTGELISE